MRAQQGGREKKNRRVRSIDSHLRLLTVPCTSFLFRLSHYLPISGRKNCCSFLQVIEQVSFFSLQQVRRSYLVVFIVIKYLTFGFLFTFMIIMMDPLSSGLPLNEWERKKKKIRKQNFFSTSISIFMYAPNHRYGEWRAIHVAGRTYQLIYDWIYGAKWAHTYGHVQHASGRRQKPHEKQEP